MIPKKARDGNDTGGLLVYLYGPGKRDEHESPRMVASWEPDVPDPASCSRTTVWDLGLLLDAPVDALPGSRPTDHVYHVAVRNAPDDPLLTDAQWAEVARAMMDAAGIAPRGDPRGCRWVAVRHADDHIHVVATKARQDGHRPNLRQDIVRIQRCARDFERRWELRRLVSGDRTARKWPTTGETTKSERRGLTATARDTLNVTVRTAAAAARDEADFFDRLLAAGLRVRRRSEEDGSVTGYSVALPGDRDGASRPVWFPGSKLAFDLSLPRVRERWVAATVPDLCDASAATVWEVLEARVLLGARHLALAAPRQGAGDVAALGDLVTAAAAVVPAPLSEHLRLSAVEFERASRAPGRRDLDGAARPLFGGAARVLSDVPHAGRSDVAAMLGLLAALVDAVATAQRWHLQQGYLAQAESAGSARLLLREAAEVGVGFAGRRVAAHGRSSGRAGLSGVDAGRSARMSAVVRVALPGVADAVLRDRAWPALARRLEEVAGGGHDPSRVLAVVAGRRELGSADSVAQVLVWRLDGWLGRNGPAPGGVAAPGHVVVPPGRSMMRGPEGPKRSR